MTTPNVEELITYLQGLANEIEIPYPMEVIEEAAEVLQSQAERINELERESETHAVIAMLQAYGAACAAHAREMALSDSELLDFVEAHPHLTLRNHKKRWSFVGLTNYEYTTFDTARAAIKATLEASEY